jgi:hypothetical protein
LAFIGRFFVVWFAVIVASIAAGMTISTGLLGSGWHGLTGDVVERGTFWGVTLFASGVTWFAGLLPIVIAIVIAEALRIRSLLIYAVASCALFLLGAFGGGFINTYEESIDHAPPLLPPGLQLAAAAGIVFGVVYWLIAGRNAGRWCERRQAANPSS